MKIVLMQSPQNPKGDFGIILTNEHSRCSHGIPVVMLKEPDTELVFGAADELTDPFGSSIGMTGGKLVAAWAGQPGVQAAALDLCASFCAQDPDGPQVTILQMPARPLPVSRPASGPSFKI